MSFYLDRFLPAYAKTWRGGGHENTGTWVGNKPMKSYYRSTYLPATYTEEVYKDFHMIIVESPIQVTQLLDDKGVPATNYRDSYTDGESYIESQYLVYAWRIGGHGDQVANLRWVDDFADLRGICLSTSKEKTIKNAKKKLDYMNQLYSVHKRLIEICDERSYSPSKAVNVKVGDEVFIDSFGRKRKGVVVGTTGSRFIVGYVTPSNNIELKSKTLYLWEIYEGATS